MNTKAIVSYLALDSFRSDFPLSSPLDPIIYTVTRSMKTEKIFLLGFYPANPVALGTEYDILVLITENCKRPLHEYESLIANRCHDFASVTSSVYTIAAVNQLLATGNLFFSQACTAENLIYDAKQVPLTVPGNTSRHKLKPPLEDIFLPLFDKAKSFLSGAGIYLINGDYQLAAFMLHQATEHTLNAILTPWMGFRLQTHNLHRLMLHARRFTEELNKVFPRDTNHEVQLFRLLQNAYLYGRYKNDFKVEENALKILFDRVTGFQEVARDTFYQTLDRMEPVGRRSNW